MSRETKEVEARSRVVDQRIEAYSEESDPLVWIMAENRLIAAVLERAIRDLFSSKDSIKMEAAEWVFDEETIDPFCFTWCVNQIRLGKPEVIKERIKEMLANGCTPIFNTTLFLEGKAWKEKSPTPTKRE